MGVPDVARVGVGTSDAVRVCVVSAGSDWVGLDEDVAIASGVGVGISDWESGGVGVGVGVSVGGIYGVAVGQAQPCAAQESVDRPPGQPDLCRRLPQTRRQIGRLLLPRWQPLSDSFSW